MAKAYTRCPVCGKLAHALALGHAGSHFLEVGRTVGGPMPGHRGGFQWEWRALGFNEIHALLSALTAAEGQLREMLEAQYGRQLPVEPEPEPEPEAEYTEQDAGADAGAEGDVERESVELTYSSLVELEEREPVAIEGRKLVRPASTRQETRSRVRPGRVRVSVGVLREREDGGD